MSFLPFPATRRQSPLIKPRFTHSSLETCGVTCFVYTYRKQTALHKAAAVGDRKICSLLVASGASLRSPDGDGLTPKMLAARFNDLDLVAYFESKSVPRENEF